MFLAFPPFFQHYVNDVLYRNDAVPGVTLQEIVVGNLVSHQMVSCQSAVGADHPVSGQKRSGDESRPLRQEPKLYDHHHGTCSAKTRLVFLKTHKTGSTTLASIFERFGYYNNLTFALPPTRHFYEPVESLFVRTNMAQIESKHLPAFKKNTWEGYDFLTNHVRYNRPEMDAVVHNATYVTILRSPVDQFESAFGYYEMAIHAGLAKVGNPIEYFMKKPEQFFKKKFTAWYWSQNAQLYDLGLDHFYHNDTFTLGYKIKQFDFEFDLVLITEYFDESLLLLRKLMCWEWEDILYLPKGIRSNSHRQKLSPELRRKIQAWNGADARLHEHFNKTLWRKIHEYGPEFDADLAFFRSKRERLKDQCIAVNSTNKRDQREVKTMLKKDADVLCHRVYQDDVMYTRMIRQRMTDDGLLVNKQKTKSTLVKKQ